MAFNILISNIVPISAHRLKSDTKLYVNETESITAEYEIESLWDQISYHYIPSHQNFNQENQSALKVKRWKIWTAQFLISRTFEGSKSSFGSPWLFKRL